jgi:hypothetical protein
VKLNMKNHFLLYANDVDLLGGNDHEEEHWIFVRRFV